MNRPKFFDITDGFLVINDKYSCSHFEAITILVDAGRFPIPCAVNNDDPCTIEFDSRIWYANDILRILNFEDRMVIAEALANSETSSYSMIEFDPRTNMNLVA